MLDSAPHLMESDMGFCLPKRRQKKGWSLTFGRTATAVFASLAMAGAPAVPAYAAAQHASVPAGNDVSYPQCGKTLPSGQAFGIVAVNEGLPNNTNPCLAAEISWAQISDGGTRQPKVSLYVNTADPGNHGVTDWPTNNNDPVYGNHAADPYGRCAGGNSQACAWQYGWDMALMDARTRGVQSPGSYRWWLDIETANSWESSAPNNRADLEGMTSYFRHIGAKVRHLLNGQPVEPDRGNRPAWQPALPPAGLEARCQSARAGEEELPSGPSDRRRDRHGHPVEDTVGEQRFLLPCSASEGESQAIVTAIAPCRSALIDHEIRPGGRHEAGLSVRLNAIDSGFHVVPDGLGPADTGC